ncbi:Sporulation related domain-containing protein [Cyclonatronum proteinivorum]|uniref:Sporulation related domain-containing protein n=2 Tax=Cyclonatronum proteinivorum TaxID=1457365 RepID=A0A345UIW6_9BACT|nr:Sporulation related domain-containing protein [Cyclonatronum proteinivorum]
MNDASAQDFDNERRATLSVHGGLTLTNSAFRAGPLGSVEVDNKNKAAFGASFGYALTPALTLEILGQFQQFENGSNQSFNSIYESTVLDFTFRTNYNLNYILGLNRVWSNFSPYISLGAGIQYYDFERTRNPGTPTALTADDSGVNLVGVIGAGANIRVTNGIDFFLQYDFRAAPDNAISRVLRSNNDRKTITYGSLFGGLRFHFGESEARHMSWRPAPMDLYEEDFNRLMALHTRMDDLERQLAAQGDDMSNLEARTSTLENRADDHETRISDLETQFAEMQETMRDRERERETRTTMTTDERGLTQVLDDGHYVQVFAGLTLAQAQGVRQTLIRELQGVVDNPAQMVLITQRRQFYEVRVGVFNRFPETANVLRTAQSSFSDAFVVTFPRPAHLSSQYQDIRRTN